MKVLFIIFVLVLVGCDDKKAPETKEAKKSNQVIFYNWEEYTPLELFEQFEKETGIQVVLKEFETVEEQVGNIQADPHFCDLTVFDAQLVPGHYHTLKLIKKLDLTKIINEKNFHKSFDQYKEYGTPLSFGLTGFAYDSRVIKEEFKDYSFLVDPKYKDKIALLDDNNDFFLCLLSMINFDYETKVDIPSDSIKELESLSPKISKNNPFISDTFANLDALVEQKVLFAHTYSGDFISYQKDHPHIKFIIPDFGLNAWSEIITLSHNAPNKENAYKLLNFLSSPEAAAVFSNEFYYANGILGSEKFLNDEIKNNNLINMSEEQQANTKIYTKVQGHNSISQRLFSLLNQSN